MPFALEDRLHGLLGRYIAAPQWVKTLAGTAYRCVPPAARRGAAYGRFLAVAQERDPARLAAYQREALRRALTWAVDTVPAYAHLRAALTQADDPFAALAHFPLTAKADIKADPSRYLSAAMPADKGLRTFTGGSTAEPMQFYLQKDVTRAKEYAFMDDFHARVGYREGDLVLALRGRSVATAATPGGRLWMFEPIKRQLILSSDHLLARWMPDYLAALRRFRPRYIQAFPSALYPLARWLAEHPAPDLTDAIRGVMLYSENVYDYQMRLFSRVFGCPVLKHYGHSERGVMAASLADDPRYYFWPQYGHVELVDAHGQAITAPGVLGEIVATGFDNQVMPFVRYRTGDMAMWSALPGHPELPGYPVVERIEGRLQEFVVCHDGRLVSICTLGAAHFEELAGVESIQYEQHAPGRVVLKVVTTNSLPAVARQRIASAIEHKTQGGCAAEVVEVSEIARTARGKQPMLIQHVRVEA